MHIPPEVLTTGAIILKYPEFAGNKERIKQIFRLVKTMQEIRRRAGVPMFGTQEEGAWPRFEKSYRELKESITRQHPWAQRD